MINNAMMFTMTQLTMNMGAFLETMTSHLVYFAPYLLAAVTLATIFLLVHLMRQQRKLDMRLKKTNDQLAQLVQLVQSQRLVTEEQERKVIPEPSLPIKDVPQVEPQVRLQPTPPARPVILDSDIPLDGETNGSMHFSKDERVAREQKELAKKWDEELAEYQRKRFQTDGKEDIK